MCTCEWTCHCLANFRSLQLHLLLRVIYASGYRSRLLIRAGSDQMLIDEDQLSFKPGEPKILKFSLSVGQESELRVSSMCRQEITLLMRAFLQCTHITLTWGNAPNCVIFRWKLDEWKEADRSLYQRTKFIERRQITCVNFYVFNF
jgi:hypothetical protein